MKLASGNNKACRVNLRILLVTMAAMSIFLVGCKGEKNTSEDVARFVKSAETYREQGQYRAAMLDAKNAIQKNPADAKGYIALAEIYNALGAYAGTQSLLTPVVEKLPEVSLQLAIAHIETRKYRSALNVLNDYKSEKVSAEQAFQKEYLLARCYIFLGDRAAFEKSLAGLKANKDKYVKTELLESEFLVSQGQQEAALVKLDALQVAEKDDSVNYFVAKGNLHLQRNELDKAEDLYTKALGLLPNTDILNSEKLVVLGQLTESLMRQGKSGEAYRYQKLIADANPEGNAAKERFNDAMELFRQGKFAEAEKTLTELREQFPQDKNSAILLGLVEYQKGRDKQAIDLFDQYIDPETSTSSIIQAAALAKFRVNKIDEAIELLKKSVDSQPENAEILATYGLALLERDKTNVDGQKALEKSLALNPKQQRLRLALAKRDFEMKNPGLALGQLQKAYNEQPLDLLIQQSYFKALFNDGKLDVIKTEILNFQKKYPNSPRGPFLDGWFNLVQKKYADAEQLFKKSIALKDNAEKNLSYAGLAEVYRAQNQPLKAAAVFESMIELDTAQAAYYREWLDLVQQTGGFKDALLFLGKLEAKPENWMPSIAIAQILLAQGQVASAVQHIDIAIERNGKSAQVKTVAASIYQRYGIILVNEKKAVEAKSYILKALLLDPNNMNILANLVELELLEKNYAEAQKLLDQYASANSGTAERDYLQGVIKTAQGQTEEALGLYKASWAKKPLEITAKAIASFYQKSNKNEELFSFVEDWSNKLPNSPEATLLMAIRAQQKNDQAGAVKWYEKTIQLDPTNAAPINNLAWIYYEQKNPKAVELAERAYKLGEKNPAIIDTYGWILVESGKVSEGLVLLQNAAALAPTNKEIQDHVAEAKKRLKK